MTTPHAILELGSDSDVDGEVEHLIFDNMLPCVIIDKK